MHTSLFLSPLMHLISFSKACACLTKVAESLVLAHIGELRLFSPVVH